MRAFIIRPFGEKHGIDFDRVERTLLQPALDQLGLSGGTPLEFLHQGAIRSDMFADLVNADLVIADISIHDASVFYELGIRHALRDRRTLLLRARVDDIPFEFRSDRSFVYNADRPGERLDALVRTLQVMLDTPEPDSPVFQLLPGHKPTDPAQLLIVPHDFYIDVRAAVEHDAHGHLRLMTSELHDLPWAHLGWRLIGEAQEQLGDDVGARCTWETLRQAHPTDRQAALSLSKLYPRFGEFAKTSETLQQVLTHPETTGTEWVQTRVRQARHATVLWEQDWMAETDSNNRQTAALRSPYLEQAIDAYHQGFQEDRNHVPAGLGTLSLLTILIELAESHPDIWAERFETEPMAAAHLKSLQTRRRQLTVAVQLAIESALAQARRRSHRQDQPEQALLLHQAHLVLLTSKRPTRVTHLYRRALLDTHPPARVALQRELERYRQLGILVDNSQAAWEALPHPLDPDEPNIAEVPSAPRLVLFVTPPLAAQMQDTPGLSVEHLNALREGLTQALREEQSVSGKTLNALAGGANEAEILFHELCAEAGIPSELALAIPKDSHIESCLDGVGKEWVERFHALYDQLPVHTVAETEQLPLWLLPKADYTVWQRTQRWMFYHALAASEGDLTLIVLRTEGDPHANASTLDLLENAQASGVNIVHLDLNARLQESHGKAAESIE